MPVYKFVRTTESIQNYDLCTEEQAKEKIKKMAQDHPHSTFRFEKVKE